MPQPSFPRYMVTYINLAGFAGAHFFENRAWAEEAISGGEFTNCEDIQLYWRSDQEWKPVG